MDSEPHVILQSIYRVASEVIDLKVACILTFLVAAIALLTVFRTQLFVWLVTSTDTGYAFSWRYSLFSCMEISKRIVEIGAGPGCNFCYYPVNCDVICVEPCSQFNEYLESNWKRNGGHLKSVKMIGCHAEELTDHIEESSVDYVVCTYVLCSVSDVNQTLQNISKILKPGGVFCYLEHTQSDRQPMRLYQSLMTPIFSRILNGCHYNRQPHRLVEDGQGSLFNTTSYHEVTVQDLSCLHPERTQVWGQAVK